MVDVSAVIVDALIATGKFLISVIPLFILGVILAQLFVELRWLDKLSWLARPFAKLGHLHPECAGAFVVAVISPTAAHSMLAKYFAEKKIRRAELIIAAIVNALPGYIAQGRSVLPITIPLLGVFGVVFYGMVLFADLIKSLLLLTVGRFILPERDFIKADVEGASHRQRPDLKQALRNSLQGAGKTVPKILLTMIPVTFLVFVLINLGVFNYAARHLGAVFRYFPIPVESLPIVATRLVSPVGAYTVAGSLLNKGVLGGGDIVIALLVGTLLATVPNVRYLIPYYFGIFGPTTGLQLVIVSTAMRIVVFAAIVGMVSFMV
ncbi:MAG: hypothetical protein JXA73_13555 [Acidobacteria bacterium]|nr:hypothetical protein [Acidobacteriota bacterium]